MFVIVWNMLYYEPHFIQKNTFALTLYVHVCRYRLPACLFDINLRFCRYKIYFLLDIFVMANEDI